MVFNFPIGVGWYNRKRLTAHWCFETILLESLDKLLLSFLGRVCPSLEVETLASVEQRVAHAILGTKSCPARIRIVDYIEKHVHVLVQNFWPLDNSRSAGSYSFLLLFYRTSLCDVGWARLLRGKML